MDTLGSLVDKLCILRLKLAHVAEEDDSNVRRFKSGHLVAQVGRCLQEINALVLAGTSGEIALDCLVAPSCKLYPGTAEPPAPEGSVAQLIDYLAETNAALWKAQEDIARIREIPPDGKDAVVERSFDLNMDRNRTIDAIDRAFVALLKATP